MDSKKFLIGGTICADSVETWAFEDVTPSKVRAFLAKLEPGEPVEFEISSPGGNCMAGLAIANLIREAASSGHPTSAHVVGIAASMASVVACACETVRIDESAFMMIHNPWTVAQGDAADLRKEADVLDRIRASIMSFYRGKFDRSDDELRAMMDAETWFTGGEAETFGFSAEVIPAGEPLRAAACCREIPAFARAPAAASALLRVGCHGEVDAPSPAHEAPADEPQTEPTPAPETPADEPTPAPETPADEPTPAPETPAGEQTDMVTRAECERRVRGMQSAMGKQIQALQAELTEAKKDFKCQLDAKNLELSEAKAEAIRLGERAERAENELRATASALEAKSHALAQLNANVNQPSAHPRDAVPARDVLARLPMSQRAAYYKAHKAEIDNQ